jgi:hypothetical protein
VITTLICRAKVKKYRAAANIPADGDICRRNLRWRKMRNHFLAAEAKKVDT